jgi:2-polyprenyl-3-methyl-5-hydroxy-6-metoxy-1,4-benzoquinol methylase
MDNSKEMLKMAEEKMDERDRMKFKTLFFNLEEEAYEYEKFDIIYSQMVLHHIKDTSAIFHKFGMILNPGGMLAIADLYQEDGSFHDGDLTVHHGFDPEELKSTLLKLDFQDITIERCFVIRKETSMKNIAEYPVFLMTAVKQGSL